MVVTNICFLILGCVLTGTAGFALAKDGPYTEIVPANGLRLVIASGFILAMVAFLGVYGSLNQNRTMLAM